MWASKEKKFAVVTFSLVSWGVQMASPSQGRRKRGFSARGSVLGAFLLLAGVMSAVAFSGPSGSVQLPAAAAQVASVHSAAVTTTTCSSLLKFLNDCPTTTTTA